MLLQLVQPAYVTWSYTTTNKLCNSTPQQLKTSEGGVGPLQGAACPHSNLYYSLLGKCTKWTSSTAHVLTAEPANSVNSSSNPNSTIHWSVVTGPSKSSGNDEYEPNFAEAVLVLREDLPLLFQQDMRFHIYRDDITFRTPSMRYLSGVWKYQLLHRGTRWLGRLLFSGVQLQVVRLWQPEASMKQLKVHWGVSGQPRLSLLMGTEPRSMEGFSTYNFDSKGKIYEHQVDQIIPPESPLVKLLEWMVGKLQPGAALPAPQLPVAGMECKT